MSFIVIYDACVLYPSPLRDLLIRIARTGQVRARWTELILDECFRNVLEDRPDLSEAQLARTRKMMNEAIADVLVTGYEELISGIDLPDPNDRHVVAAAVRAGAQVIVSSNLKDFPREKLAPLGIEAVAPDDFVLDCIDLAPDALVEVVEAQARSLKNPPQSVDDVLRTLEKLGLVQSVAKLRAAFAPEVP